MNTTEEEDTSPLEEFDPFTQDFPETESKALKNPVFRDGQRQIDWILVFFNDDITIKHHRRALFVRALKREGLQLEFERGKVHTDIAFMKIHAPLDTLIKNATIMDMKLPYQEQDIADKHHNIVSRIFNRFINQGLTEGPRMLRASFNQEMNDVLKSDKNAYFSDSVRFNIVWNILRQAKVATNYEESGIANLLNSKTYIASYPLHDGDYAKESEFGKSCQRHILYTTWARPGVFYKMQPLEMVSQYLGDEVGLYFAWLGCYTFMLVPAAVVGVFFFLYGCITLEPFGYVSQDICDSTLRMCPNCGKREKCDFHELNDYCKFSRLSYVIDNSSNVFFAVFMTFWATIFMEMWKRQQSILGWKWNLTNAYLNNDIRPEFANSAPKQRFNYYLRQTEPYFPFWQRALRVSISVLTVILMVTLLVVLLFGILVYQLNLQHALLLSTNSTLRSHSIGFTTFLAAIINLIIITIVQMIYGPMAIRLTNFERPRTDFAFEQSYTFKVFVFKFVNNYTLLFYIAFMKGRLFSYPGDKEMIDDTVGIISDKCSPAGCLPSLFIQLCVVMIGKQLILNTGEIMSPIVKNWLKRKKHKSEQDNIPCWEEEFMLLPTGNLNVIGEQMEMVVQYGFVTLFVAAFPLAPLLALINNIAEIRIDAYKMLTQQRRRLSRKVTDMGAFGSILHGMTFVAVVVNAFVIAYAGDSIPRMMYKYKHGSFEGYLNHTLSTFAIKDFHNFKNESIYGNGTCRYRGYRYPPDHPEKYTLTSEYYEITVARFIFIVIFEHLILLLTAILAYAIPDIPTAVKQLMFYEETEGIKARTKSFGSPLKKK